VCCCNRCHGSDVKGFWALLDSIYDYATLDIPVILGGKFAGVIHIVGIPA
jgi:hypothetical protein